MSATNVFAPSCVVCNVRFSTEAEQTPLLLLCGHSVCARCDTQARATNPPSAAIVCPLDQISTALQNEMKQNKSLADIIQASKSLLDNADQNSKEPTDAPSVCVECQASPAQIFCGKCETDFCSACASKVHAHRALQCHSNTFIAVSAKPKSSVQQYPKCPVHDEPLKMWCCKDRALVCVLCLSIGSHAGHASECQLLVPALQHEHKLLSTCVAESKRKEEMTIAVQSMASARQELNSQVADNKKRIEAEVDAIHKTLLSCKEKLLSKFESVSSNKAALLDSQAAQVAETASRVTAAEDLAQRFLKEHPNSVPLPSNAAPSQSIPLLQKVSEMNTINESGESAFSSVSRTPVVDSQLLCDFASGSAHVQRALQMWVEASGIDMSIPPTLRPFDDGDTDSTQSVDAKAVRFHCKVALRPQDVIGDMKLELRLLVDKRRQTKDALLEPSTTARAWKLCKFEETMRKHIDPQAQMWELSLVTKDPLDPAAIVWVSAKVRTGDAWSRWSKPIRLSTAALPSAPVLKVVADQPNKFQWAVPESEIPLISEHRAQIRTSTGEWQDAKTSFKTEDGGRVVTGAVDGQECGVVRVRVSSRAAAGWGPWSEPVQIFEDLKFASNSRIDLSSDLRTATAKDGVNGGGGYVDAFTTTALPTSGKHTIKFAFKKGPQSDVAVGLIANATTQKQPGYLGAAINSLGLWSSGSFSGLSRGSMGCIPRQTWVQIPDAVVEMDVDFDKEILSFRLNGAAICNDVYVSGLKTLGPLHPAVNFSYIGDAVTISTASKPQLDASIQSPSSNQSQASAPAPAPAPICANAYSGEEYFDDCPCCDDGWYEDDYEY